jgi:putative transposase
MKKSRAPRLHVPGGMHYVVLHANEGRELFQDTDDHIAFAHLTHRTLERCRASIHAFCWTSKDIHFAIQVTDAPLSQIAQRLAGQHARYMNRRLNQRGHLFQQRYWAALLKSPALLPEVVRHIHLTPVRKALVTDPTDHLWSSHRMYLGLERAPWVTTSAVFRSLNSQGGARQVVYQQYIQEGRDALALGPYLGEAASWKADEDLLERLGSPRRRRADPELLNRIIDSVCEKLAVPRAEILSQSRKRKLSLARALVAWHATENAVATLTQVAQCFNRNPSALHVGVSRYRNRRSELFEQSMQQLLRDRASGEELLNKSTQQ